VAGNRWDIAIQVRGSYREVLTAARWAESFGLGGLALPDHYLSSGTALEEPAWDNLIQLAGLARETKRIELVDLVSPVTFRHPAVYAKTAVTISDMSDNRFWLGLGTGWMEEEHQLFGFDFPDTSERFLMLEEALGYLDALAHGIGFEGPHYRLESFASAPAFETPIVVGGSGLSKTPALAGHFAREFNIFPSTAGDIAERIELCLQTATLRGRSPSDIRLSFACIPAAGMDEAGYRKVLAKHATRLGREPDQLEGRLAHRGIPHGTREQVIDQVTGLADLGITRLYLQCGTPDPTQLEKLVEPYLP
jgi:alkanesulfonate monooxygenase SsuD/methylene tetrahydromethanopterin reductase-like flavin-dependent oxidoreductase (luciferase family)